LLTDKPRQHHHHDRIDDRMPRCCIQAMRKIDAYASMQAPAVGATEAAPTAAAVPVWLLRRPQTSHTSHSHIGQLRIKPYGQ
jgi:hypothetical protein